MPFDFVALYYYLFIYLLGRNHALYGGKWELKTKQVKRIIYVL